MDELVTNYNIEKNKIKNNTSLEEGYILDKTVDAVGKTMTNVTTEILEKGYTVKNTEDADVLKALLKNFSKIPSKFNDITIKKILGYVGKYKDGYVLKIDD
jgi:hypothetical protein